MRSAMKYRAVRIGIFSGIALLTTMLSGAEKLPAYKGHVNDFAGVLNVAARAQIENALTVYEDSTSTQIAVVIEKTLGDNDVFQRAIAFAEGWGVGSKENNNGVLLYLAIEDRKYFTVTSQATQGKLTDGIVGQIERDHLVPHLKNGNYASGIYETVTAYMAALEGEFAAGKRHDNVPGWIFFVFLFGLILFILIANNARYGRGYRGHGAYWFPTGGWGGGGSGWGGSGGGGWGGFGGGGGFDGGGAGGSW